MVELIVENESLDLYPDEVISLTMAINDMASIESREGNFSNKFTIPSTSKNNAILGFPNELNFVTGFKPTKSRDARISIDGLDVQRGFIQVEQFNQLKKEFSVSFFSGNTDWLDDISDKKLIDIKLVNLNHIWNSANVVASFSNTEGYIYPFIHYGRYDSVSSNNTDLINWLPAMFTHTLIRQMFDDIDWKTDGDIFKDPVFLKHIIPFSIKELNLDKATLDLLGFTAVNPSGTFGAGVPIIFPDVTDGNTLLNYDDATGIYTSNANIVVDIFARFEYVRSAFDRIEIRKNGIVSISAASLTVIGSLSLAPTDTVTITTNNGATGGGDRSIFSIKASTDLVEGMTMPMSSTLPDMSQEALLQTVFNQFGVVFTSDNISKTVFLNKFEKVKDNIINAIDWTNKLDKSREVEVDYTELVSDYSKVNNLVYKDNEDYKVGGFASQVPQLLGNGSFIIDNDFLSNEDDLFSSDFTSSASIRAFNNRALVMYVPRYSSSSIGENSPNVVPKPRCAICVNDVSVSDIFAEDISSIDVVGSSGTTNATDVPYPYFNIPLTGLEKVDTINQCLSFGDNTSPKAHKNLIETYYQDFVSILNTPRRVTAYFLLNERDINNLDFLIPIYLGGELNSYFYINKIKDYRPSESGVTKVELVLIV